MAGTKLPKGTIEPKELKALNDQYIGGVKEVILGREVEIERSEEGKEKEVVIKPGIAFYVRKPDRGAIKFAFAKAYHQNGTVDNVSPGAVVLSKCWIGGCEEAKTNDFYYFRACVEMTTYLNEITGFY